MQKVTNPFHGENNIIIFNINAHNLPNGLGSVLGGAVSVIAPAYQATHTHARAHTHTRIHTHARVLTYTHTHVGAYCACACVRGRRRGGARAHARA